MYYRVVDILTMVDSSISWLTINLYIVIHVLDNKQYIHSKIFGSSIFAYVFL